MIKWPRPAYLLAVKERTNKRNKKIFTAFSAITKNKPKIDRHLHSKNNLKIRCFVPASSLEMLSVNVQKYNIWLNLALFYIIKMLSSSQPNTNFYLLVVDLVFNDDRYIYLCYSKMFRKIEAKPCCSIL